MKSRTVTLAAAGLSFYAQADERGVSEGDIINLPGGRVAAVESLNRKKGQVTARILPSDKKTLDAIIKRWFNFTGHAPDRLEVVPAPKRHSAVYQLGQLRAVEYECVKDGKLMAFRHQFKKSARPALAVTPDGQQLVILGGGFQVTERGIVDD